MISPLHQQILRRRNRFTASFGKVALNVTRPAWRSTSDWTRAGRKGAIAISVADSNSSIREALTTILRETAADAHRALPEIPVRKDPDKPRTKAWRCSCGPHLIPPRTFRALQDVRRRKVLSHFATVFLLKSFGHLENERAATEVVRNFFADLHTSRAWLTVALGINDAVVERKARSAYFVSGGRPPKQLLLSYERTGAAKLLAGAFNSALESKLREFASREPSFGLVGCSLPSSVQSHSPDSVEPDPKLSTENAKKGGRPRKDDERRRVLELRAQKKSWTKVAILMNKETGQTKTQHAYRMLAAKKVK